MKKSTGKGDSVQAQDRVCGKGEYIVKESVRPLYLQGTVGIRGKIGTERETKKTGELLTGESERERGRQPWLAESRNP